MDLRRREGAHMPIEHPQFPPEFCHFQNAIDWVDQPPPALSRDTHALEFRLFDRELIELDDEGNVDPDIWQFEGLLFFRPGNPNQPIVQRQPGLDGLGIARPTRNVCGRLVDPNLADPEDAVRVKMGFRPPRVFCALTFFSRPPVTSFSVEPARTLITDSGDLEIRVDEEDPPRFLMRLGMTTVLRQQLEVSICP